MKHAYTSFLTRPPKQTSTRRNNIFAVYPHGTPSRRMDEWLENSCANRGKWNRSNGGNERGSRKSETGAPGSIEEWKSDIETARAAQGYLEEEDYVSIKNEFHFLAKVASSEALIEYNDTKEVDENIDMLENDIEQLSIDELS